MDLAICISVKNRSNLVVNQEDPNVTYRHLEKNKIIDSPSDSYFPPTLNRDDTITLNLLPKLLMSLVSIKRPLDKWSVIIVDYESTDVNVDLMANGILGGYIPCIVHTEKSAFSRGTGLHIAAKIAKERGHNSLFFCDADMYFTRSHIFEKAELALSKNKIYYPICFSFTQCDHLRGFWRDTGYGMLFIKTEDYFSVEQWKHNVSWGEEDNEMLKNFKDEQITREKGIGYYHQWHPESIVFKTQEYPIKSYVGKNAILKNM